MLRRIIGFVTTGVIIIISVTTLMAIISILFVGMFELPRWERLELFGHGGVTWLITVIVSYVIAGWGGAFLAGFSSVRDDLSFDKQCTEAVISGLLISLFSIWLLIKLEFELFLVIPAISVSLATGGCWVRRIYDKNHRRVQIIGGVLLLTITIISVGVIASFVKVPFGCPPSCDRLDLTGQDLRQLEFQDTSLKEANFSGANLYRANFWNSDLKGANLSDADLSYADFQDANLLGANLTNVITEGTNFNGAIMPDGEIYQNDTD